MAGKRGARYRVRKIGFADLARDVTYVVDDTEAQFDGTVDVFSERRHGPEARRLALERRDAMNRQLAAR